MTTRADLYALTSGKRAELGPVELFNPEGIGGLELTFRADTLLGDDMSAVWRWSQRLGDPIHDVLVCPGASAGRPGTHTAPS